eukprot:Opistho-2@24306
MRISLGHLNCEVDLLCNCGIVTLLALLDANLHRCNAAFCHALNHLCGSDNWIKPKWIRPASEERRHRTSPHCPAVTWPAAALPSGDSSAGATGGCALANGIDAGSRGHCVCATGPGPLPRRTARRSPSQTYAFEITTASTREMLLATPVPTFGLEPAAPDARHVAIAADKVHPVPCESVVARRGRLSHVAVPLAFRK